MRISAIFATLLVTITAGDVLQVEPPPNFTSPDSFEPYKATSRALAPRDTPSTNDESPWEDPYDKMWNDALCRGERLLNAMTLGELDAAWALGWPYLQSPWEGDLRAELRMWGWLDSDENHKNAD